MVRSGSVNYLDTEIFKLIELFHIFVLKFADGPQAQLGVDIGHLLNFSSRADWLVN